MPKEKVEDSVDFRGLCIAIAHKFAHLKEVLLYLSIEGHYRFLMLWQSDKKGWCYLLLQPLWPFLGRLITAFARCNAIEARSTISSMAQGDSVDQLPFCHGRVCWWRGGRTTLTFQHRSRSLRNKNPHVFSALLHQNLGRILHVGKGFCRSSSELGWQLK
jgi:hypothetical protein